MCSCLQKLIKTFSYKVNQQTSDDGAVGNNIYYYQL